jgi:hypothetical protein
MRPGDIALASDIDSKLTSFHNIIPMPGINSQASRSCLIEQIIDSVRRIKYVTVIKNKTISPLCADATNIAFDPIKAASWHKRQGNLDEAFWLVFLATHFGKNLRTKWRLVQDIYGGLGNSVYWNWNRTSSDINGFRSWLDLNEATLRQNGKFGNHRKYESLNAYQTTGTGEAVATYVNWIVANGNHLNKMSTLLQITTNPRESFLVLYNSMNDVKRFGRTARFDYLTMLGKLELVNIEPDSTYMNGSTGPIAGAKLLFGSNQNPTTLNLWLTDLESHLNLHFGMQILEDSLCNWQKSPNNYRYFGG